MLGVTQLGKHLPSEREDRGSPHSGKNAGHGTCAYALSPPRMWKWTQKDPLGLTGDLLANERPHLKRGAWAFLGMTPSGLPMQVHTCDDHLHTQEHACLKTLVYFSMSDKID